LWEKLALERYNFSNDFDQKPAGALCMGGPGSGNWYRWNKCTTLDEVKQLDVRRLHRQGALQPWVRATVTWHRGEHETGAVRVAMVNGHLVIEYHYRGRGHEDWEDVRQVIALDWTPCHYGGQRPWLLCPGCQRRVAILYGEGKWFLCRHCYELPYGSQQETAQDRHYRKVRKIRDRLGASHNLMESIWPWNKPKGMHWRTWERLRQQEEQAHRLVLADLEGALARLRWGL
jgi:hypothetical protein